MSVAAPVRKKPGSTVGHPTDIRIGICRGVGLSRDDTARVCGVSVPTVDLRKDEPVAREWEEWASELMAAPSMNAAKHLEEQARKRVPKALQAFDKALDSENEETALRGADRVLDRAFGKATQRVETTVDSTERVIHEIPAGAMEAVLAIAEAMRPKRITGEVIDVQQIEEGD